MATRKKLPAKRASAKNISQRPGKRQRSWSQEKSWQQPRAVPRRSLALGLGRRLGQRQHQKQLPQHLVLLLPLGQWALRDLRQDQCPPASFLASVRANPGDRLRMTRNITTRLAESM